MIRAIARIFADASTPKNRLAVTYPLPGAYVREIFRLNEGDIYQPLDTAEYELENVMETRIFSRLNRNRWIFTPQIDEFTLRRRPAHKDDPLNLGATGGIICNFYNDIYQRNGLTLAIFLPRPLKPCNPKENAVFCFSGYVDMDTDKFYIHELRKPEFSSLTGNMQLIYDHHLYEEPVAQTMAFAEYMADALFTGNGDKAFSDRRELWETAQRLDFRFRKPKPWEKEKAERRFMPQITSVPQPV